MVPEGQHDSSLEASVKRTSHLSDPFSILLLPVHLVEHSVEKGPLEEVSVPHDGVLARLPKILCQPKLVKALL